jgi:hypothetical protein
MEAGRDDLPFFELHAFESEVCEGNGQDKISDMLRSTYQRERYLCHRKAHRSASTVHISLGRNCEGQSEGVIGTSSHRRVKQGIDVKGGDIQAHLTRTGIFVLLYMYYTHYENKIPRSPPAARGAVGHPIFFLLSITSLVGLFGSTESSLPKSPSSHLLSFNRRALSTGDTKTLGVRLLSLIGSSSEDNRMVTEESASMIESSIRQN